jgi:hypothetical protein
MPDVTILKTKKKIAPADIKAKKTNVTYTEVKVGNYTIYESAQGLDSNSFCMPENDVVVIGSSGTLRKVLERNSKPKFSDRLTKAIGQADFGKNAVQVKDGNLETGGLLGVGASKTKPETVVTTFDMGKDMKLTATAFFSDAKLAESGKKEFEDEKQKMIQFMSALSPEMGEMFRGIEVTVSGSKVIVRLTLDVDKLIKAAQQFQPPGGRGK